MVMPGGEKGRTDGVCVCVCIAAAVLVGSVCVADGGDTKL